MTSEFIKKFMNCFLFTQRKIVYRPSAMQNCRSIMKVVLGHAKCHGQALRSDFPPWAGVDDPVEKKACACAHYLSGECGSVPGVGLQVQHFPSVFG